MTPLEAGWKGIITLELSNTTPLPLEVIAGQGIGQMIFHRLDAMPERDYGSKPNPKYQDQKGLTPPRVSL